MSRRCPICETRYDDASAFCPTDGATLVADAPEAGFVGAVLADRYRVTGALGEGGMGTVWRARHVRLPQDVAIKVLRPEFARDAKMVARFVREASNAARIVHPNVVRILDSGELPGGTVYIAMEFVDGRPLGALVGDGATLAPARTARLVRDVAEGIAAAHALGIVHRDLKPDNVMVATDATGTERALVLDFGIAKAMHAEGDEKLTKTGFVVGTPEYMSPEQVMGDVLGPPSDTYALALLAYRMLAGALPFDTTTTDRGLLVRLTDGPRPLAAVRPDVPWPAALQGALDAALTREPARRTADPRTFAAAFAAAIDAWRATGADVDRPATSATVPMLAPPVPVVRTDFAAHPPTTARATPGAVPPTAVHAAPGAHSADAALAMRSAGGGDARAKAPLLLTGGLALVAIGVAFALRGGGGPAIPAPPPASITPPATPSPAVATPPVASAPVASAPVASAPVASAPVATRDTAAPSAAKPPVPSAPIAVAAPGTRAASARTTLDSITRALDPATADEGTARTAISRLVALLPRLGDRTDSTWAYVRLTEAQLLIDDRRGACRALSSARRLAATTAQREVVARYDAQVDCAP